MNDLDRTLHDAFQSRHVPHDIRPSLVDVRWRARRRHNRRKAAVVGCAAVTGAGAVAVLAARHPGADSRGAGTAATVAGAGDIGVTSTIACYEFPSTTTSIDPASSLAPIPTQPPTTVLDATTTTTMPPTTTPIGAPVPCDPAVGYQNEWHCTDWLGTDDLGRDVYLSCEQLLTGVVPTTTPAAVLPTVSTIEFPTSTTSLG